MIFLFSVSILASFSSIMAKYNDTSSELGDSNKQFKIILALIVAIVLIITILVIVIIILFALSGRGKKKKHQNKLPKVSKRKTAEGKDNNNNNRVFVAKGQSDNEKAKNDVGQSGSFVFSGYSSDKPIPIEDTYDASESGLYQPRPTDLNVRAPPKPLKSVSQSKSVLLKDKTKPGI